MHEYSFILYVEWLIMMPIISLISLSFCVYTKIHKLYKLGWMMMMMCVDHNNLSKLRSFLLCHQCQLNKIAKWKGSEIWWWCGIADMVINDNKQRFSSVLYSLIILICIN